MTDFVFDYFSYLQTNTDPKKYMKPFITNIYK